MTVIHFARSSDGLLSVVLKELIFLLVFSISVMDSKTSSCLIPKVKYNTFNILYKKLVNDAIGE